MTKIELRKTKLREALKEQKGIELSGEVDYGTLIVGKIDSPGQGGMTTRDMRRIGKMVDIIEEAQKEGKKFFEVDDDQLREIKDACIDKGWPFRHNDYMEFEDYMKSL